MSRTVGLQILRRQSPVFEDVKEQEQIIDGCLSTTKRIKCLWNCQVYNYRAIRPRPTLTGCAESRITGDIEIRLKMLRAFKEHQLHSRITVSIWTHGGSVAVYWVVLRCVLLAFQIESNEIFEREQISCTKIRTTTSLPSSCRLSQHHGQSYLDISPFEHDTFLCQVVNVRRGHDWVSIATERGP